MSTLTQFSLLVATLFLTGCTTNAAQIPPEDLIGDQCAELRYQIIANDHDRDIPEGQGLNPALDASLYKDYERLNCEEIIPQRRAKNTKN